MQKKKRYLVNYSENHIYEIVVEADSKEEAEELVNDGSVDFDTAREIDSTLVDINHSEEVTD